MAIIWNKIIPRWGGATIEPPEAKKDEGYLIDDVPPASWENWLRKGTYEALDETRDVIEGIDSQLAQMASYDEYELNANQSIPNNSSTTIALTNRLQQGSYSCTTGSEGVFTVLESGVYEIILSVLFASVGNESTLRQIAVITVSGTAIKGISASGLSIPNLSIGFNVKTVNYLEAGTTFRAIASQISGAASNILKDTSTRIKIRRVG